MPTPGDEKLDEAEDGDSGPGGSPPESDLRREPAEEPGEVIEEAPPELASGEAHEGVPGPPSAGPGRFLVQVRVGALPVSGKATATEAAISPGAAVIVRTSRGTELGVATSRPQSADGEIGPTVGHVIRVATAADLERQREIEEKLEPEEVRYCRQKIQERGLKMKLSGVEHLWGGERIVFYFTAERRVDFRALVRDLAWHFHTRIELRQIGARDEARLLADFEHCGRELCCKAFLTNLEPVSMRMAKLQRTTLDPHKISGRCGRLMCCLRFEDEVYRELLKSLPPRGARVRVGQTDGEVVSAETLTQTVTVRYADGETAKVPLSELTVVATAAVQKDADSSQGARNSARDVSDRIPAGGEPRSGRSPADGQARQMSGPRGPAGAARETASLRDSGAREGKQGHDASAPSRRGPRQSARELRRRDDIASPPPPSVDARGSEGGSGAALDGDAPAKAEPPPRGGDPTGGKDGAE